MNRSDLRKVCGAVMLIAASSSIGPAAGWAQQLPEVDKPNALCGQHIRVRQLTFHGRTGAWIPEAELSLPASAATGQIPDDPTTLVEVSRYHPDCDTSAPLAARAEEFVRRAYRVALTRGWDDFEQARADGFEPYKAHVHNETHFVNVANSMDDRLLDPEAPEYLMYYDTPDGPLLVGMMFMVRTFEERGPQFGGGRTIWHYHAYEEPVCLHRMQISSPLNTSDGPQCELGELAGFKSPEMLHVWFVDHPAGAYATSMILPPGVLAGGVRDDLKSGRD